MMIMKTCTNTIIPTSIGALPQSRKKSGTSGKIFYSQIKSDVGVSCHEKESEQEDAYTKTESLSTPHPYFFISFNNL